MSLDLPATTSILLSEAASPSPLPPHTDKEPLAHSLQLHHLDVGDLIIRLPAECADLLMFDPPWEYEQWSAKRNGGAGGHYECLPTSTIARIVAESYRLLRPNRYCVVWCTFPKLAEWFKEVATLEAAGFRYLSGGAWGKTGAMGVGIHLRGDTELLLVYAKGYPRPRLHLSNLFLAPRAGHSIKPERILASLLEWATPVGGLVVDPFAGESASLAKVCRRLGRAYIGSEVDEQRYGIAVNRLGLEEQADFLRKGDLLSPHEYGHKKSTRRLFP